ncbi:hypothetical protein Y1Q_0004440 [Alligator mississippiensis]|uniref:Uncharacterized protein n=1 Tax=Alligator mississippiensis TaxID=8496 RepID=A0A151NST5_ALLMI|nr:hypothetical protein Y1Q_0004440 [Alligator mississippiensis]
MFRMKREMFYHIVTMLVPHITRQDTNIRSAILPGKRVAMAIMNLASPSSLRYIANPFSVTVCTVGQVTCEICQLLRDIASNKVIHLVNPQQVTDGFNEKGFPNCAGALESTHVPDLCPAGSGRLYANRKRYASVILQALVDHLSSAGWWWNTRLDD